MLWPRIDHPTACDTVGRLSQNVYTRLWRGEDWGVRQGEVTITDVLLLDMAVAGLTNLHVRKVTQKREARDGMDWLMALPVSNGWLVLAFQAKKLQKNDKYNLRHEVGEKKRQQIDLLGEFCKRQGAIGGYVLYNSPDHFLPQHWHCHEPFNRKHHESLIGCTIVPLADVMPFVRRPSDATFKNLHSGGNAIPIRCLFHLPPGYAVDPDAVAANEVPSQQSYEPSFDGLAADGTERRELVHSTLPFGLEQALDRSPYPAELDPGFFPEGRVPRWIVVASTPTTA